MAYNFDMKIMVIILVFGSIMVTARTLVDVVFQPLTGIPEDPPFLVVAPKGTSSVFVRFLHPRNGKSAVARVIQRNGQQYVASQTVVEALGLASMTSSRLIVEHVQ